jgi:hypothetical protein
LGIRQRAEQGGAHHRKDGRVRSDPQGQGENGDRRKGRRLALGAETETQVLHEILDKLYTAHVSTLLPILGKPSDGSQRSPAGFARRHAGDQVLFDLPFEMKAKFGVKLAFHGAAVEQRAEPQTDFAEGSHLKPLAPPG